MRKNIMFLIVFAFGLFVSSAQAADLTDIEVFDIQKEQVIATAPNSEKIQQEIKNSIEEITGISKSLNPIPKEGVIIKIPLEPSVSIENEWMHALIDEAQVIIPKSAAPLLLVFNDENIAYFFEFNYDLKNLLMEIGFEFLPPEG